MKMPYGYSRYRYIQPERQLPPLTKADKKKMMPLEILSYERKRGEQLRKRKREST